MSAQLSKHLTIVIFSYIQGRHSYRYGITKNKIMNWSFEGEIKMHRQQYEFKTIPK